MIKYLILLILLFILICNYGIREYFTLPIYDKRGPPTFNNNYDKIWLRPTNSINSTTVQDIPNLEYINDNKNNMIKNIEYSNELNDIFKKYIKLNDNKNSVLYYVENSTSNDDMTIMINNLNKKSWINKNMNLDKDIRLNYLLKICSIKTVNLLLQKIYNIVSFKFIVYKYKISNVSKYENGKYSYGLIVVLLQKFGYFGYTIYISGYIDNNKIIINSYKFIGHYYTSNFFLKSGFENNDWNKYTLINKDQKIKTPDKFNKIKNNKLFNYKCFSINNDINNDSVYLPFFNKEKCESSFDIFNKKKPIGIWDKPCEKNSDCFFYNQNLNYDNNFGGCNNGYCQLPIDVSRIGYKYYKKDKKSYCYNCNSKSWKAITNLGMCCDKQNDKQKYPFLKSPDYAFKGDTQDRLNYYRQNNYK